MGRTLPSAAIFDQDKDELRRKMKPEGVRASKTIWTWCPFCYIRRTVEILTSSEYRCTVCKHTWKK